MMTSRFCISICFSWAYSMCRAVLFSSSSISEACFSASEMQFWISSSFLIRKRLLTNVPVDKIYLFLADSSVLTVSSREFCISDENLLFSLCLTGTGSPMLGLCLDLGLSGSGLDPLTLNFWKSVSSSSLLISTKLGLLGSSVTVNEVSVLESYENFHWSDHKPLRGRAVGWSEKDGWGVLILCLFRLLGSRFLAKLIVLEAGLKVGENDS